MSKTTSYAMYPHSVIGFGCAIDGFKLFAHLEAKAFKTKLCVHTSCDQIQELSAPVSYTHLTLPTIYSV